jgi:hypothetical protein
MLLDCRCGSKNRIPGTGVQSRVRCGKCKHVFTPAELVRAVPEAPPPRPSLEDLLGGGIPNVTGAPDEGDYDDEEQEDEDPY